MANMLNKQYVTLCFSLFFLLGLSPSLKAETGSECPALLNFEYKRLGEPRTEKLCDQYNGKLILIVNTASKCAFTPQYDGLEALYRKYQNQGLVVLGFPSNDFAGQEPGTEKEILNFCRLTYSVEFPMFEKVGVIQPPVTPFYIALAEAANEAPRWNFHKYLVSPDGSLIASFPSHIKPEDTQLISRIEANLPGVE